MIFQDIVNYYNLNKDNKLDDWIEFYEIYNKQGKQGLVGLVQIKNTEYKCVFKISQYLNYLVEHEYTIMNGLMSISMYCPHFCRSIGKLKCLLDPKCKKNGNPFEINSKYPIEKDILLMENIENSIKFYNYIRSDSIDDNIIYSIVKQVLLAIVIAQRKKKFTHYDLHSCNIMIKKCNKDAVFLYVIDEENQFCVPTYGYYPIIIDFGFSYIEDMEGDPLWTSLAHTNVGFMSDRFDWVADPKLFLVTIAYEIKTKRSSKLSRKFNTIIKNIFSKLKIDWEAGWDIVEKKGAIDYVTELFTPTVTKSSSLFDDYEHYCIDIIQSLIILPLERQECSNNVVNLEIAYKTFLNEFIKIENEIGNSFYNLYILKCIVDIARSIRVDYYNTETRLQAIEYFKIKIFEKIQSIAKFCNPKNLHYEKMICSLYILARNTEGILYKIIKARMIAKEKEYEKLPVRNIEQIYAIIDVNIPDEYEFNSNTVIHIFDSIKETSSKIYDLSEENISNINSIHSLGRGTFINQLFNQ